MIDDKTDISGKIDLNRFAADQWGNTSPGDVLSLTSWAWRLTLSFVSSKNCNITIILGILSMNATETFQIFQHLTTFL